MAFCSTCGNKNDRGSFCSNCGNSLASAPAYAPAGAAAQGWNNIEVAKTNTLAIVSLVASLLGIVTFGAAAIAGIICGHISLSEIKKTNEQGRGMAIAGLIVGYVQIGLIPLVAFLFLFGIAMSDSYQTAAGVL